MALCQAKTWESKSVFATVVDWNRSLGWKKYCPRSLLILELKIKSCSRSLTLKCLLFPCLQIHSLFMTVNSYETRIYSLYDRVGNKWQFCSSENCRNIKTKWIIHASTALFYKDFHTDQLLKGFSWEKKTKFKKGGGETESVRID